MGFGTRSRGPRNLESGALINLPGTGDLSPGPWTSSPELGTAPPPETMSSPPWRHRRPHGVPVGHLGLGPQPGDSFGFQVLLESLETVLSPDAAGLITTVWRVRSIPDPAIDAD